MTKKTVIAEHKKCCQRGSFNLFEAEREINVSHEILQHRT